MIDTTFRVTLQKSEMFGLQVTLFSAKKQVICQRWLGFPYRGKDLDKLEVLSQTMGSLVQETEDRIYAVTRQTESRLATLPKVTKFEENQETDIFNKQNEINTKTQNSKEQFATILRNLRMTTDVADLTNTMGKLVGQLMNVRYMVEFTLEPLNFPLGLITRTYHPHVDTGILREYKLTDNVTTPAVLFYFNQTTLILKIGAEQTLQTDETYKSYFMDKIFNKNTFYTVTLVDIVLIASSSFVSIMALIGIIINCCNIRKGNVRRKKDLLYRQVLGSRALKVNQVSTDTTPARPVSETPNSFFRKVSRKKNREIGLPTTLPYVQQIKKSNTVRYLDDLPRNMLVRDLSLNN